MSRVTSADFVTMPTRMAGALQHFEDLPHDLVLLLDRLIRIGVGADRDRCAANSPAPPILFPGAAAASGFDEQLGFEIEAGREAEIGMVGRAKQ